MKLLASLTLATVVSTLSVPAMAQFQKLADATHKGWALAESSTLDQLQDQVDRPLQPRPRGRPRKQH